MGVLRVGGPEPRRPLCWGTEIESLWAHSQLIGGDIPILVGWWCCTCYALWCWDAVCLILGVLSLVKCLPFETAAVAPFRGVGGVDRTWVAWGQTPVIWLGTIPWLGWGFELFVELLPLLWWYHCSVWWFVCLDLQCSLSCPLHPNVVPKSWFSLPSAGSVSVHPMSTIWPLCSVLALSLKRLHLPSNPAGSGVRLDSLWCPSCSCCLGHLSTGELSWEVWTALGWKEASMGWWKLWTAHVF